MLLGVHVSPAGGPANAVARGEERGCTAIQIFNQSPRAWKGRLYHDEEVAAYREALADSPVQELVIHAIYLINCASTDRDIRRKSAGSLVHALRTGEAIGADGVVVHPGSAKGEPNDEALPRVAELLKHALDESDRCPLLLENTAGAGDTIGRSFEELAQLIKLCGRRKRVRVCLDSCHLLASGFDIRTADKLAAVVDRLLELVGDRRVSCLHMNDSQTALGSNRDRHAPPGDGELGPRGCAAFLSEPRFEDLPVVFEGPGVEGKAPAKADVDRMKQLRRNGLRARRRRARK